MVIIRTESFTYTKCLV